jgi:hypothetical protein
MLGMAVGWLFGCSFDVVVGKMRCEWTERGTAAVKGWGGENRDTACAGCDQPCNDENSHSSHGRLFTVPVDHGHDATHECGVAQIALVNWQIG